MLVALPDADPVAAPDPAAVPPSPGVVRSPAQIGIAVGAVLDRKKLASTSTPKWPMAISHGSDGSNRWRKRLPSAASTSSGQHLRRCRGGPSLQGLDSPLPHPKRAKTSA